MLRRTLRVAPLCRAIGCKHGVPEWAQSCEVAVAEVPFCANDAGAQIAAVALGMTALPCFVGDTDEVLLTVPGSPRRMHDTIWLLTQGETRKTKRVQLFTEFISIRLAAYTQRLVGRSYARD